MTLLALVVLMQSAPSLIHFDWSLNIGNVVLILMFVAITRKYLMPIYRTFLAWDASLKFLLEQYAKDHDMSFEEVQALAISTQHTKGMRRSKAHRAGA